jgi:GNAT superfamily N-acetyltransferase
MTFNIRNATEADFPAVLEMIKGLALFEKAPEKVTNSVEQMKEEQHLFRCAVAETSTGEIVGMALWFYAYYTWVGKSLYLDDLYVRESYRKNRIGTMLLNHIMEEAKTENCKRVRWQVLNWNKPAIDLYRKSGAVIDGEWLNCDFDAEGVRNFRAIQVKNLDKTEETSHI